MRQGKRISFKIKKNNTNCTNLHESMQFVLLHESTNTRLNS